MGNSQFIKRNIFKSAALNAYINELVKCQSLATAVHSETIWNTCTYIADITNLNLERFDEDVIKGILSEARVKYPMFSLTKAPTSLDQLRRWQTDGIYDELDKVFNGNESDMCTFDYTIKCGNLALSIPTDSNVFKSS